MKCLFKQEPMTGVLWTGDNHREMCEFLVGHTLDGTLPCWHKNFEIDHEKVRGGLIVKRGAIKIPVDIGWFVIKCPDVGFVPCDPENFKKRFIMVNDEPFDAHKTVVGARLDWLDK